MLIGLLFAVGSMVFNAIGAIVQSGAAVQVRRTSSLFTRPRFIAGLGVDVLAWTCTVVALRFLPVFAVQATVSGSIALTALWARYRNDEWLRPVHRLAIGASIVGLILVATSAGGDREVPRSETVTIIVMVIVLALLLIATVAVRRMSQPWPAAILAGLGLGLGSVSVRAMHLAPGNIVVSVLTEPLVYVLVGTWATGLFNWAHALRLGDVATVTALFMVTQVIVPGLVAMALLGDTVRDGWVPATVVGLLLAVYGVSILARRKPRQRRGSRVR